MKLSIIQMVPKNVARQGWEEAFKQHAGKVESELLEFAHLESDFDKDHWHSSDG